MLSYGTDSDFHRFLLRRLIFATPFGAVANGTPAAASAGGGRGARFFFHHDATVGAEQFAGFAAAQRTGWRWIISPH